MTFVKTNNTIICCLSLLPDNDISTSFENTVAKWNRSQRIQAYKNKKSVYTRLHAVYACLCYSQEEELWSVIILGFSSNKTAVRNKEQGSYFYSLPFNVH